MTIILHRVRHAVTMLRMNPSYKIAGCSKMNVYFSHVSQVWNIGPFGKNHATAASFAFTRDLLDTCSFNNSSVFGEEKYFLKDNTIPVLQLDINDTILVISHTHNTINKEYLLETENEYSKLDGSPLDVFIENKDVLFFVQHNMLDALDKYEPGLIKYKPGVVAEKKNIQDELTQKKRARLKNIQHEDVKKMIREKDVKIAEINEINSRLTLLNQSLVHKVRSINTIVQGLTLDKETQDLLKNSSKLVHSYDIDIHNINFTVIQNDEIASMEKIDIARCMKLVKNNKLQLSLSVNNQKTLPVTKENVSVAFLPHTSRVDEFVT